MGASATVKYHYPYRFFTYSMTQGGYHGHLLALKLWATGLKTLSGGEFGWGGTSVKK